MKAFCLVNKRTASVVSALAVLYALLRLVRSMSFRRGLTPASFILMQDLCKCFGDFIPANRSIDPEGHLHQIMLQDAGKLSDFCEVLCFSVGCGAFLQEAAQVIHGIIYAENFGKTICIFAISAGSFSQCSCVYAFAGWQRYFAGLMRWWLHRTAVC